LETLTVVGRERRVIMGRDEITGLEGGQFSSQNYLYIQGMRVRDRVSKLFPDFFTDLEKLSLDEQLKLVSTNMRKWAGRWIEMVKSVNGDKNLGVKRGGGEEKDIMERWSVVKEEWDKKIKSGEVNWEDEDNKWMKSYNSGVGNWWKDDGQILQAHNITQHMLTYVFDDEANSDNRYAMICGFVLGTLTQDRNKEDFFMTTMATIGKNIERYIGNHETDDATSNGIEADNFKNWFDERKLKNWTNKVREAQKLYEKWRREREFEAGSTPISLWEMSDLNVVLKVMEYGEKEGYERLGYDEKRIWRVAMDGLEAYKEFLEQYTDQNDENESMETNIPKFQIKGKNLILYGVPGSGKSHAIKREIGNLSLLDIKDDELDELDKKLSQNGNIVRVVFHPDYTYSDFVGQILPKTVDIGVIYEFRPGPFTRILKSAIDRPTEPFFLIIDEINRGNAAAIFGDLFQLLDRKNYKSVYEIDNHEIQEKVYDKNYKPYKKIFIPKNLWLFATMNTSDQNVVTLDTAFQRRWEMKLIPNEFEKVPKFFIKNTGVTWRTFAEKVNDILKNGNEMMSGDKQLGAWFIQPDDGDKDNVSRERFANKVLKYLWDDAFKFKRDDFFNTKSENCKTLEKVIKTFIDHGFDGLFKDNLFASEQQSSAGKTDV
jgi:hypothetical protein